MALFESKKESSSTVHPICPKMIGYPVPVSECNWPKLYAGLPDKPACTASGKCPLTAIYPESVLSTQMNGI